MQILYSSWVKYINKTINITHDTHLMVILQDNLGNPVPECRHFITAKDDTGGGDN